MVLVMVAYFFQKNLERKKAIKPRNNNFNSVQDLINFILMWFNPGLKSIKVLGKLLKFYMYWPGLKSCCVLGKLLVFDMAWIRISF